MRANRAVFASALWLVAPAAARPPSRTLPEAMGSAPALRELQVAPGSVFSMVLAKHVREAMTSEGSEIAARWPPGAIATRLRVRIDDVGALATPPELLESSGVVDYDLAVLEAVARFDADGDRRFPVPRDEQIYEAVTTRGYAVTVAPPRRPRDDVRRQTEPRDEGGGTQRR